MKIEALDPPRKYSVRSVEIRHCGNIRLEPDEQVTFTTASGREYDVTKKSWGFFATPSVNGRLKIFGYRTAVVRDPSGKRFVCLVETEKEAEFRRYLEEDNTGVEYWLSDDRDPSFGKD
ncbi:MAG: hypothetical protein ABR999_03800 [Methanoregula sp.]|jgi:hypothetical protein|uniref:hypothetical protein n=1 Tax=Methanoregula sp. TaxID=2052170 RepID=UPI003D0B8516